VTWLRLPEVPVTVSVYVPAGVPDGGFTVSEAVFAAPPVRVAVIVAADALLVRYTGAPSLGAGPLRVIVPVEDDPPVTLVGLSPMDESVGDPGGLP
jgi:hypothetical protein